MTAQPSNSKIGGPSSERGDIKSIKVDNPYYKTMLNDGHLAVLLCKRGMRYNADLYIDLQLL